MSPKAIEIMLLKDSDIPEVIQFYNSIHHDNRDQEKFLWEFYSAPAGKAIYVVAKDIETQKIIGTQCAIPIDLITTSGLVIRSGKSEDTLVHPDYRGLSIFERMYQLLFEKCTEDGIKYLWGFTAAKKPFLKLGFTIPYDHSQSLLVLDVMSSFSYLSALNSKNTFLSLAKIFALCISSKLVSNKRFLIQWDAFRKKFNYAECSSDLLKDQSFIPMQRYSGFWIKQDMSFMRWRIDHNPYLDSVFNIGFSDANRPVANIIFNHHKNGVWYLISDSYADDLQEKERAAIFNQSIKVLLQKNSPPVSLIRTWDFRHTQLGNDEINIRRKSGFVHIERGISFVWKSLDAENVLSPFDFNLSRIASQGTI